MTISREKITENDDFTDVIDSSIKNELIYEKINQIYDSTFGNICKQITICMIQIYSIKLIVPNL